MSQNPVSIKSIAVITGRDLVGDALIKLPFARALRHAYPDARIHWVTSQGATAYATLLREPTRSLIDVVNETPDWLATTQRPAQAPAPQFDLILDTRNRWKEALHARKIPHKIFIAMAARYWLSDRHPPLLQRKAPHLCDRLLRMIELAAGYCPPSTGSLPVAPALLAAARQLLPEGKTYIGIAPGAGNPIKLWPRYKFEQLALAQAEKGRVPVFILGPQEFAWYEDFLAHVPNALYPLQNLQAGGATQIGLDHTLALASLLDLAVANDSGTGHMLAAVDCPIISLFGPTSASKCAPRASHVLTIRAQDFGGDKMDLIPWEVVDRAVDQQLAARPKVDVAR